MSHHSGSGWKDGEPITDQVVKAVASAIIANHRENKRRRYTPSSFIVMNDSDKYVFFIGHLLDLIGVNEWTKEGLKIVSEADENINGEMVERVLRNLGVKIRN